MPQIMKNVITGLNDDEVKEELSQEFNITSFNIENFTYESNKLTEIVLGHLENTSFEGITVSQTTL